VKAELAALTKRVADAKGAQEARVHSTMRRVVALREWEDAEEKKLYGFCAEEA
jgi:hypothetical protein